VLFRSANITEKVTKYCTSLTANDSLGGTKKKSNSATDRKADMTAGPRPSLSAIRKTTSRNSMTIFAKSRKFRSGVAIMVVNAQTAIATAYLRFA
jgi:hypothetical protein